MTVFHPRLGTANPASSAITPDFMSQGTDVTTEEI